MPDDTSMTMATEAADLDRSISAVTRDVAALRDALNSVIVGQAVLIDTLLLAVFSGGHVLLEGLPGLGKTHLAKALAAALGVGLGRVQCTPDLLPSDMTGGETLDGDLRVMRFRPGPVFANLVLVDEINRATPRTQAALLEAMQERQVSCAGERHALPDPFWVVATQNPIELEGTFPLPEAQLDRFQFKLTVEYPDAGSLGELLDTSLDAEPANTLKPVISGERAIDIQALAREVHVAEPLRQAAIALLLATQPAANESWSMHIRYGASPRALQALVRAARVRALFDGRVQVDYADLLAVARPVLNHRILLHTGSELDGVTVAALLDELLDGWHARHVGKD